MANPDDIPPDVLRQRRNLLLVSVGILIFVLGKGQLGSVPSPFGLIRLEREWVLLVGVYLFFWYSLWRYWLYLQPYWKEVRREYQENLAARPEYQKLLNNLQPEEGQRNRERNMRPYLYRGLIRYTVDLSKAHRRPGRAIGHTEDRQETVPALDIIPMEVRAAVTTVGKHRRFSDFFLPYLVACLAIIAMAYDVITRWIL